MVVDKNRFAGSRAPVLKRKCSRPIILDDDAFFITEPELVELGTAQR